MAWGISIYSMNIPSKSGFSKAYLDALRSGEVGIWRPTRLVFPGYVPQVSVGPPRYM
jgi:hypothetical protein